MFHLVIIIKDLILGGMSKLLKQFWANVAPILWMMLFIALFIIGIFVFSYILIIAAAVGLILFVIAYVRTKIAMRRQARAHHQSPSQSSSGRIIEHDEIKSEERHNKDSDPKK